jgi:serine protease Do
MRKNIFILLLIVSLPTLLGFWAGYRIGHHQSEASSSQPAGGGEAGLPADDPSTGEGAVYQSALRDSADDVISNQRRNAITRAVASASPAVVGINVTEIREYTYRDPFSQFFGQYFGNRVLKQEVKGLGSGFLVSADGYILTNDHVAGNAKEITVTMTNRSRFKAKLIGTDLVSDISLLKIEGKDLPYVKLGNSDDVIIGEWVIAMGNPFGLFEINDKPTVTVGVVSATGINLNVEGGRYYRGMIQTDAAINEGNSGGPLLNSMGEVIGVNAVIFTPNQGNIGLGFAIPVNRVKGILAGLKKNGRIERDFWTGLEVNSVDERVANYFGLVRPEGVIVTDVKRSSPAERGGFKVGDIIVSVNGEHIANEDNITSVVGDAKAGDVLSMDIIREKRKMTLSLKLERRPS